MLCRECPKKSGCIELCVEAEFYVDQDCIGRKEMLPETGNFLDESVFDSVWDYQKDEYTSTVLKNLIIKLHIDGKNEMEIAYHLPCSQPYIHKIITKFKTNQLKLLEK